MHVISSARELVWDAKEQNEYESKSQEYENRYNNRGWFSWTGGLSNSEIKVLQQKFDDDSAKNFNPLVYQPKFDQSIGIIAVGPRAWRHMLAGLQFGLYSAVPAHRYTGDNQTEASSDATNIVLPTVGFIASVDRSGFSKFFYRRSIGWFTKRFMAKEIGTQALAIVLGKTREFKPEDIELGINTFEDWPQKKEPDEKDLEIQSWIERGDWIQLEPSFIQKLQIYTQ